MAKELSKEQEKLISWAADEVETEVLKVLMHHKLTMHEGLSVLSVAVYSILTTSAKVLCEDEKMLIDTFCESLKV